MLFPTLLSAWSLGSRLSGWLDAVVPRRCALCAQALAQRPYGGGLCLGCLHDLPGVQRPRCSRCARPTAVPAPVCTGCAGDPALAALDATLVVADYAPPLDRMITRLKFGGDLALAQSLGELLALRWAGDLHRPRLEALVPVPLAAPRLASRGFNQSLEIARAMRSRLAQQRGLGPVLPRALFRTQARMPQVGLDLDARRLNLAGTFACNTPLEGCTVGVVDDVMTTGSTLGEAARALKAAGAARVVGLVVARTP